ncbi:Uncharacterised protein [Actinomyces bovis]|uniref:Uncharacterized protein n=1 Tax=Actinomyces bovis TaxID=1658 RepID=A0ABY1VLR7_9ACTO|nr:Uncharacterised protein [Actinomyces bovis]VEG53038.1 Uncharacterised protein [Actinomyces israelii]
MGYEFDEVGECLLKVLPVANAAAEKPSVFSIGQLGRSYGSQNFVLTPDALAAKVDRVALRQSPDYGSVLFCGCVV